VTRYRSPSIRETGWKEWLVKKGVDPDSFAHDVDEDIRLYGKPQSGRLSRKYGKSRPTVRFWAKVYLEAKDRVTAILDREIGEVKK
jgi:hypothetical protein